MSKRDYTHTQTALPEIHKMIAEGKLYRETADYYGVKNEKVIRNLIYREKHKPVQGVPKPRGRKPASFVEANDMIDRYIHFYNHERIQLKTGVAPLTLRHST